MGAWTQFFPPKPRFTDADLPNLQGKVYVVTGSNSGVGKELATMLYAKHARVYVAARSETKAKDAITSIETAHPQSKGELIFLRLDLADLTTIKGSANELLMKERKLHVLFNNAGIMTPPDGSKSAQGYELQLGVNNLGTFLFTRLLTPLLQETAKKESPGTVRVVWVSSFAAENSSPKGGIPLDNLDYHVDKSDTFKYGVSKAGNYLHATEFSRRYARDGIISVALNPGNLATDLYRHRGGLEMVIARLILHPQVFGAYTELFAGLSPDVSAENIRKNGHWVIPWGRFQPIRRDLADASKPENEGGSGIAEKWWQWSEKQVKQYL